jgi:hypothetical protein
MGYISNLPSTMLSICMEMNPRSIYARSKPPPKTANVAERPKTSRPRTSNTGTDPTAALLLVAPDDELEAPLPVPVSVEDVLLPDEVVVFWPPTLPITPVAVCETVALLATPLTLGMLVALAWKSTMLLVVELKFVCATATRLFLRSYTT